MGEEPVKVDPVLPPKEISQTKSHLSAKKEVEEKQLKCEQCGEKFTNVTHLEEQRAIIHDFPEIELKKSQNFGEKLSNTTSQLGGEIVILKPVKNIDDGQKTTKPSLGDEPVKVDPILPIEISQTKLKLSAKKKWKKNN